MKQKTARNTGQAYQSVEQKTLGDGRNSRLTTLPVQSVAIFTESIPPPSPADAHAKEYHDLEGRRYDYGAHAASLV